MDITNLQMQGYQPTDAFNDPVEETPAPVKKPGSGPAAKRPQIGDRAETAEGASTKAGDPIA